MGFNFGRINVFCFERHSAIPARLADGDVESYCLIVGHYCFLEYRRFSSIAPTLTPLCTLALKLLRKRLKLCDSEEGVKKILMYTL